MDGIRGEVSNKIRSAIKAKLLELGAYVDDELPDYIMVMVANKRSKQQMEEDLLLFLGDSTSTFTAWLHSVLNKLQQVTVNNPEIKKSSDKKRVSSDDYNKKDKKKKAKKEKEIEKSCERGKTRDVSSVDVNVEDVSDKIKHIKSEAAEMCVSEDDILAVDKGKRSFNAESALQPKQAAHQSSLKKQHDDKTTEDDDDDFINLKADVEADLWGETEESPPITSKDKTSQPPFKGPPPVAVAEEPSTAPEVPPSPCAAASSKTISKEATSDPSSSIRISSEKVSEPKLTRIIKISEALRQEHETLNPPKHPSDPQNKTRIPSLIVFHPDKTGKEEDDDAVFGRLVAHELRQLTLGQKNLAKLKIQQALAKRVLLSHVVNQKISAAPDPKKGGRKGSAHHSDSSARRIEHRETAHLDLRQTLNKERRKEKERTRTSSGGRGREREREHKQSKERNSERRHPSLLASVVRSNSQLVEEEEKADTSVASVVRIKPRPRLPVGLQANRSLILKAVAEAQKSVHKAPLRPDPALKTMSKEGNANHKIKFAVSNGAVTTKKLDGNFNDVNLKKQLPKKTEVLQKTTRLPPREALKKMSVTVPREPTPPINRGVVAVESEDGSDSPLNILVQIPTSPLAPEDAETVNDPARTEKVLRWIEDVEEATKSSILLRGNNTVGDAAPTNCAEHDMEADSGEIVHRQMNLSTDTCEEASRPESLLDVSNDCNIDSTAVSRCSDDDPQFVVTLDGLDPDFIDSFEKEDIADTIEQSAATPPPSNAEDDEKHQQEQEMRLRDELLKQQQQARENQMRQELLKQQSLAKELKTGAGPSATTSPLSAEKNVLKRTASPDTADAPPSKVVVKISSPERCKFWPTCRHGDKCEFYHPSVPCKLFPKCKYADRCLYIHPNCRFNSSCSRVDCPYTHFGPRPAISCTISAPGTHSTGQVIKQACKFYPNCNNRNCPFIHPTVCRFGTHCTKLNCQFIHSEKVLATKHKWVRT